MFDLLESVFIFVLLWANVTPLVNCCSCMSYCKRYAHPAEANWRLGMASERLWEGCGADLGGIGVWGGSGEALGLVRGRFERSSQP